MIIGITPEDVADMVDTVEHPWWSDMDSEHVADICYFNIMDEAYKIVERNVAKRINEHYLEEGIYERAS